MQDDRLFRRFGPLTGVSGSFLDVERRRGKTQKFGALSTRFIERAPELIRWEPPTAFFRPKKLRPASRRGKKIGKGLLPRDFLVLEGQSRRSSGDCGEGWKWWWSGKTSLVPADAFYSPMLMMTGAELSIVVSLGSRKEEMLSQGLSAAQRSGLGTQKWGWRNSTKAENLERWESPIRVVCEDRDERRLAQRQRVRTGEIPDSLGQKQVADGFYPKEGRIFHVRLTDRWSHETVLRRSSRRREVYDAVCAPGPYQCSAVAYRTLSGNRAASAGAFVCLGAGDRRVFGAREDWKTGDRSLLGRAGTRFGHLYLDGCDPAPTRDHR